MNNSSNADDDGPRGSNGSAVPEDADASNRDPSRLSVVSELTVSPARPPKNVNDSSKQGTDEIFHVPSGIHMESINEYTVEDIVQSTNEGSDVSDQIANLERKASDNTASRNSLFPRIEDSFLDIVELNEEEEKDTEETNKNLTESDCGRPESIVDSTNLSDLTKRLARYPSMNHYQLPSQANGLSTSHVTKTGTDIYYENAARIFPTRTYSNEDNDDEDDLQDVEEGSYDIGQSVEGSRDEASQKTNENFEFKRRIQELGSRTKADIDFFREFLEPHREGLNRSLWNIFVFVILPSLIMAIILFYGSNNPPVGLALDECKTSTPTDTDSITGLFEGTSKKITDSPTRRPSSSPSYAPTGLPSISHAPSQFPTLDSGIDFPTVSPTRKPTYSAADVKNETLCRSEEKSLEEASLSWWFLFIGVRQVITFCMAVATQLILVDFLTFRTRFFPKLIGTKIALAIAQSKGWPCVIFFWAILDMIFLFGSRPFARHWLYYQDFIGLFNSSNPSGNIPGNKYYQRIVYFLLALSAGETIKRTVMANFVGKRVVVNYRSDLTKIIKKLLTIGEIAELSNLTQEQRTHRKSMFQRMSSVGRMVVDKLEKSNSRLETVESCSKKPAFSTKDPFLEHRNIVTASMMDSRAFVTSIFESLDEWEEPEQKEFLKVSIKDVLHFRRAVDFIHSESPFSPAFGRATTREECARGSQKVFEKLQGKRMNGLDFDVLLKIAQNPDGSQDRKKIMELVRLFRPNRNGVITKLEFVKSIDSVYKQLRLIMANINSSSQIDRAYGKITNVAFGIVAAIVGLAIMGVNVGSLFVGIAGIFVSFAFMIGSASSKYLEGILLILVRKPYEIGDKVCFLEPNAPVDDFGPPSGGWIVERVDLYTTTVRLGTTREYATFANGSLANSRILNLKRSDKPNIYMYLKFSMNLTQEQLDEFRRRITEFIKDRPREWIKVVSLRCTHFETEQQYLKFALIVQHRESWQNFSTIQVSKGEVYVHALHLMKELNMHYSAPELPVRISGNRLLSTRSFSEGGDGSGGDSNGSQTSPLSNDLMTEKASAKDLPIPDFTISSSSLFDGSAVRRKGGGIDSSGRSFKSQVSFQDNITMINESKDKKS